MEISPNELETCIAVLTKFHDEKGMQEFHKPPYKPLRKALLPLLHDLRSRLYRGKDPEEYEEKRRAKIEQYKQKERKIAQDRNFINNTEMRAQRISNMNRLQREYDTLPCVPDGAAKTTESSKMIEGNPDEVTTKESKTLYSALSCYVCKCRYQQLHKFYSHLCPKCADFNYTKRTQCLNFKELGQDPRIAIVTGSRVKIGYETCLKLLRWGATVVATTRFPADAALRYSKESDFELWKHRLHIYGLDLRDYSAIQGFVKMIATKFDHLDILINNATQTIRRPVQYYRHLLEKEVQATAAMQGHSTAKLQFVSGDSNSDWDSIRSTLSLNESSSPLTGTAIPSKAISNSLLDTSDLRSHVSRSVWLSQQAVLEEDHENSEELFPTGQLDGNGQQIDLRKKNSWRMTLPEIESGELAEVFAINTLAPFILNSKLLPLMHKSPHQSKFIVNVSAMEGKFNRHKMPYHPHTNMAKAAVNMMTRTCAADLARQCVYMNSVDTGWINDENPRDLAQTIAARHNFQTPIDEVDAAARILDPIYSGLTSSPSSGKFFKDYRLSEW